MGLSPTSGACFNHIHLKVFPTHPTQPKNNQTPSWIGEATLLDALIPRGI